MGFKEKKLIPLLLSGVVTIGTFGPALPVSAEIKWQKRVLLPSAGISYSMGASKVSFSDVKKKVVKDANVSRNIKSQSTVAANVGAAALLAGDDEVDTSDITETTLTDTQKTEKTASDALTDDYADITSPVVASANAVIQEKEQKEAEAAEEKRRQEEEQAAVKAEEAKAKENEKTNLAVSTASDFVYIRDAASLQGNIVGKFYSNAVGTVLENTDENGWIKIQSGDCTGYVKAEYVATGDKASELASEVATTQAVVSTETLRVRAAASADADVITLVGAGEELAIIDQEGNWYKVDTPDGEGYISADFTDVEVIYPEAESKEEEEAKSAEAQKAAEEQRKADEAKKKAAEAKKAAEEAAKNAKSEAEKAAAEQKQQEADKAAEAAQEAQNTADAAQQAAQESESDSSDTSSSASSSGSAQGQAVVNYACQFIGNPYVWGGSSLTSGTDCSGFTMSVYAHFGVSLPHYDGAQRSCGTAVASLADAQPGDLICYSGHVGIYMGNGQIVHASNPRTGITTGNASYRQIVAIRRIFN